jgi:hypothetical protein
MYSQKTAASFRMVRRGKHYGIFTPPALCLSHLLYEEIARLMRPSAPPSFDQYQINFLGMAKSAGSCTKQTEMTMQKDFEHQSQDSRQSLAEQIEDAYRRRINHDEATRQGSFKIAPRPETD